MAESIKHPLPNWLYGLGQRLSMDAAGVIAQYVMDGDRPLTAETGGSTNFYLYGLGAIGEKTAAKDEFINQC